MAALTVAGPAAAAAHMLVGLQDDAQFLYGDPAKVYPNLKTLHVQVVRMNLVWGGTNGVANTKPAHPMDPADKAYRWGVYDRAVENATLEHAKVLFTIYGSPRWANGGQSPNHAPKLGSDLQKFAYAAAQRYSGSFIGADGRALPPVRSWMAWNEPNDPVFLTPQYARKGGRWVTQATVDYVKICKAVYAGVHGTLLGAEKVACGGTNPRGNNNPKSSRPSIAPIAFLVGLKKAGLKQFDVYAHHPYYQSPADTPATRPKQPGVITLGNIDLLIKELTRLYGPKRLWITEYGFQTDPPDRIFGVSYAKQAAYLTQAFAIARKNPRIDLMVWFLMRDETSIANGWQSGLMTAAGKRKPAYAAFARLPH